MNKNKLHLVTTLASEGEKVKTIISSCQYRINFFSINWQRLSETFDFLNVKNLYINFIIKDPNKLYKYPINRTISHHHEIYLITISDHIFFEENNIMEFIFRNGYLKDKIFIFEDYTWEYLKKDFDKLGYKLHSGTISNRHILSPVEIRLAHFLICIDGLRKNPTNESFMDNFYKNETINEIKKGILNESKEFSFEYIEALLFKYFLYAKEQLFKLYFLHKDEKDFYKKFVIILNDPNTHDKLFEDNEYMLKIYNKLFLTPF